MTTSEAYCNKTIENTLTKFEQALVTRDGCLNININIFFITPCTFVQRVFRSFPTLHEKFYNKMFTDEHYDCHSTADAENNKCLKI